MAAKDGCSPHALLRFAAVLGDSHHLIRSDLQLCPPSAHLGADLLECLSMLCSKWQR
jgi:hypothetical protein